MLRFAQICRGSVPGESDMGRLVDKWQVMAREIGAEAYRVPGKTLADAVRAMVNMIREQLSEASTTIVQLRAQVAAEPAQPNELPFTALSLEEITTAASAIVPDVQRERSVTKHDWWPKYNREMVRLARQGMVRVEQSDAGDDNSRDQIAAWYSGVKLKECVKTLEKATDRANKASERAEEAERRLRIEELNVEALQKMLKAASERADSAEARADRSEEIANELLRALCAARLRAESTATKHPKMELMSSRIRREELQRQAPMVVVGAWYLRRAGDAVKVVPKGHGRSLTTACIDDYDLGGQFVYGSNSPGDLVARLVSHDDSSAPSDPWTVRP